MDLSLYTLGTFLVQGSVLTEETSVRCRRASGAQIVKTVHKGMAGVSPGAPMISIDADNAVPNSGFEYDPGDAIQGLDIVEGTLFAASRTLTTKGFILDDSFGHSVENPSNLQFSFVGPMELWAAII